jgi:hypothetical protein
MAQKTVVSFIDDLDGESEAEGTVPFSLDGVDYEIDLTEVQVAVREARGSSLSGRRPSGDRYAYEAAI